MQTSPESVAKDDAIEVSTYDELRKHVAQLSYANKDYILFYRGQKEDYKNQNSGKSSFYPSMYRDEKLDKNELKFRWEKLHIASDLLKTNIQAKYPRDSYIIRRKKIVQWSILQHYEVTETPLIDVTQSLKVACSFAVLDNDKEYAYVYVFALPYYTNRISVNSEHFLTNVRLISVAPPQALRPYYQEGFLIGEDEFNETYVNKKDELDLNNRLVAKFKIKNNSAFWSNFEKALSKEDLYPQNDEFEILCKKISAELLKRIAENRSKHSNGSNSDRYYAFMTNWIAIEKSLKILGKCFNRESLSSASLINMIQDNDLRRRLHKARTLRNLLVHNYDMNIDIADLPDEQELEQMYNDLDNYLTKI